MIDPSENGKLLKSYIVLSVLLTMLTYNLNNRKSMQSSMKLLNVFEEANDLLIELVESDLSKVRIEMRKAGVRILEEVINKDGARVEFICKKYVSDFRMVTRYLKAQVEEQMREYINRMRL